MSSSGTPLPVSKTPRTILPPFRRSERVTLSPSEVYFIALSKRAIVICLNLSVSTTAVTPSSTSSTKVFPSNSAIIEKGSTSPLSIAEMSAFSNFKSSFCASEADKMSNSLIILLSRCVSLSALTSCSDTSLTLASGFSRVRAMSELTIARGVLNSCEMSAMSLLLRSNARMNGFVCLTPPK